MDSGQRAATACLRLLNCRWKFVGLAQAWLESRRWSEGLEMLTKAKGLIHGLIPLAGAELGPRPITCRALGPIRLLCRVKGNLNRNATAGPLQALSGSARIAVLPVSWSKLCRGILHCSDTRETQGRSIEHLSFNCLGCCYTAPPILRTRPDDAATRLAFPRRLVQILLSVFACSSN